MRREKVLFYLQLVSPDGQIWTWGHWSPRAQTLMSSSLWITELCSSVFVFLLGAFNMMAHGRIWARVFIDFRKDTEKHPPLRSVKISWELYENAPKIWMLIWVKRWKRQSGRLPEPWSRSRRIWISILWLFIRSKTSIFIHSMSLWFLTCQIQGITIFINLSWAPSIPHACLGGGIQPWKKPEEALLPWRLHSSVRETSNEKINK